MCSDASAFLTLAARAQGWVSLLVGVDLVMFVQTMNLSLAVAPLAPQGER